MRTQTTDANDFDVIDHEDRPPYGAPTSPLQQKINGFQRANPEMYKELSEVQCALLRRQDVRASNFVISLTQQLFRKGWLSEKQIAAWERGRERTLKKPSGVTVDLQPIRNMFEAAVATGYKSPKYRAEGLVITRAGDHSANPGALYIKSENGAYGGKLIGTQFTASRDGASPEFAQIGDVGHTAATALAAIAGNPLEAAVRYGRRTGRCACCGRKLTNHASIDRGIGPICAERWGFA